MKALFSYLVTVGGLLLTMLKFQLEKSISSTAKARNLDRNLTIFVHSGQAVVGLLLLSYNPTKILQSFCSIVD